MGGGSDELDLASNIGGCGVIGAIYGGVKAAWALAPTGEYPLLVIFDMFLYI